MAALAAVELSVQGRRGEIDPSANMAGGTGVQTACQDGAQILGWSAMVSVAELLTSEYRSVLASRCSGTFVEG